MKELRPRLNIRVGNDDDIITDYVTAWQQCAASFAAKTGDVKRL